MAKFKVNPASALYHLVKNDVHKLEYDPKAQFEFHRRMSFFWVSNFLGVLIVYAFFGGIWAKLSVLYLVLVSLYANFATDYGAMPGSHAAIKADEIQAKQLNDVLPTSVERTQTKDYAKF
jgi:hypothetical protein